MNKHIVEGEPAGEEHTEIFRLAVYEAGHAIAARALGLRILELKMLPRPPVLSSEKTFSAHSFRSFVETLDIRIIELMGGHIAETMICGKSISCAADIARIDELTRMVAAFDVDRSAEDIWFDLEDAAEEIFIQDGAKAALLPLAHFIHAAIADGQENLPGSDIEALLDDYMPRPRKNLLQRLVGRG